MTSLPAPPAWSPGAVKRCVSVGRAVGMQQARGAPGGRGCALFPLLSILVVQGECASWLGSTSGRGRGRSGKMVAFPVPGWGVSGNPPLGFCEGRKEGKEGMWADVLSRLAPPTAESWFPSAVGARPPCVTYYLDEATIKPRRAQALQTLTFL